MDELINGSDRFFSESESLDISGSTPVRSSLAKQKQKKEKKPSRSGPINQSILTVLNAISDRLSKIENSGLNCKKTSDVSKIKGKSEKDHRGSAALGHCVSLTVNPSVSTSSLNMPPPVSLRQEARVWQEVQARLRKLADNPHASNTKIKSQRGGLVGININIVMLAGHDKDRITYTQLSTVQWLTGFCRTMRDKPGLIIRNHTLDYLTSHVFLQRSAMPFHAGWNKVKLVHCWRQKKIGRIYRAHAPRHAQAQNNSLCKNQDKNHTDDSICSL